VGDRNEVVRHGRYVSSPRQPWAGRQVTHCSRFFGGAAYYETLRRNH
jgi:hypothetical protein